MLKLPGTFRLTRGVFVLETIFRSPDADVIFAGRDVSPQTAIKRPAQSGKQKRRVRSVTVRGLACCFADRSIGNFLLLGPSRLTLGEVVSFCRRFVAHTQRKGAHDRTYLRKALQTVIDRKNFAWANARIAKCQSEQPGQQPSSILSRWRGEEVSLTARNQENPLGIVAPDYGATGQVFGAEQG